jgi:hypothetical protein
MDEWARRQLLREDAERDWRLQEWRARRDYEARFRSRHPWLARIVYGKALR